MFWNPKVDYNNLFRDPSKFILLVRNCERFGSWRIVHFALGRVHVYQLHAKSSCLHSILLATLTVQDDQTSIDPIPSPFDSCVPAFMDLIQQDFFGITSEMKEAEEVIIHVCKFEYLQKLFPM
jgi:hypothetical protein